MLHGVPHDSSGESDLVCGGRVAVAKVHLVETSGSHRHDIVAEKISVVLRGHTAHIDGSLKEAIVDGGVTSIDQDIVVVAERQ